MLAMMIVVGVMPLATISWMQIRKGRLMLSTEQQQYQLLLATAVASELDLHVEGLSSEVRRVAQALGVVLRRGGAIPTREIEHVLKDLPDARISYVRFSYVEDGALHMLSAGEQQPSLDPLFTASFQRAAQTHAQGQPLEDSPAILSDPFVVDGTERTMLAVAAPVDSAGAFRGALTALVDIDRVWREVTVRNQKRGQLLVGVNSQGKVFATSDPRQAAPGADLSDWGTVQNFLSDPQGHGQPSTPFEVSSQDATERYVGTYEVTHQGWGIFVQARDEEIYWVVRDMERTTLIWTIVLLVVAVLAAFVCARTLSNPIDHLAAAARALAAGDFSARADVRSQNEIGELAETFNGMAGKIEDYILRLRQAFEEKNELFDGTIRALAQAIDAKDPYTRGHSGRVNHYTMLLAREMRRPEINLHDIYVSSLLHDVGKIGIDDAILKKTGQLTEREFAVIKTHAALGATIMEPIPQMKNIIPGLRHHHERCDGSGYPDGLVRDRIPLMARIIAVADTFDAITTVRPYQQPMTFERACARINELRGDSLDADVVDAFNRLVTCGKLHVLAANEAQDCAITPPPAALAGAWLAS